MKINTLEPFNNVFEIIPNIFDDERGFFFESYSKDVFIKKLNIKFDSVQDNHSMSNKNVVRGLHFQKYPYSQQKLVRCIKGRVLEVVVDIQENSKTFLKYCFLTLDEFKKNQIFIPNGYAHGFLSLNENTEILYKTDNIYSPENQITLKWDDPTVNIQWPIDKNSAIISDRDKKAISFKNYFNL